MGFEAGGACGSDMVQWCVQCCFLSVLKRSVTQILQNWCNADLAFLVQQLHGCDAVLGLRNQVSLVGASK
jgi:hypothetical protein